MKFWNSVLASISFLAIEAGASTVNWSAGIDHGFSLEAGGELPVGSLVRLGWFRDPQTGQPLSDSQLRGMKSSKENLEAAFVQAGTSTIGSGFMPALPGHFSAVTAMNGAMNLAGRQIYLWVLNAPTVAGASEHAILYWSIDDTVNNPDETADPPGARWRFPESVAFPGSTTIDLTDLTEGTGDLGAGARLLVGNYPMSASSASGAANFALANFYQPPVVATPGLLAGGSVNVFYSQSLRVEEGESPYSWSIASGALPGGLVMSSGGAIQGRPTAPGVFHFEARVTDNRETTAIRAFSITVASLPLAITSPAKLPSVGVNDLYAMNLGAAGGTAPYRWEVISGTLPEGVTLTTGGLLSGTPTAGGVAAFRARCADAGGLVATKDFLLEVIALRIATGADLVNGVLGAPYRQNLLAVGGKPPYSWSLTGGALPPDQLPGSVLDPAGVIQFTPQAEGVSIFTLEVRDALNAVASREFRLEVLKAGVPPTVNRPVFPGGVIGSTYAYRLTGSSNTARFSATGLPPGLELDPVTGWITGRPNRSGSFSISVRASNSAGLSPVENTILSVRPFPGGRFIGLIAPDSVLNGNLGGRLDLTTTSLGRYTLRLIHGAGVIRQRGSIEESEEGSHRVTFEAGGLRVNLILDEFRVEGSITGAGPGAAASAIHGWRSTWSAETRPALEYRGYYSMGLEILSVPGGETRPLPEGTGFLRCDVRRNGDLSVAGRAADGSVILTRGFLGPEGEALVHTVLYSKRGSVTGRLQLSTGGVDSLLENSVDGLLTWVKPRVGGRIYPSGFGLLTLAASGKYLAREAKGFPVLGRPEVGLPATLNFAGGNIESTGKSPDVSFFFSDPGKVSLPAAGSLGNPARVRLAIPYVGPKRPGVNGLFSGQFHLSDSGVARTVKFQGMIIRGGEGTTLAYGYFLLPQLPVGGGRASNTPILSGQVTISQ